MADSNYCVKVSSLPSSTSQQVFVLADGTRPSVKIKQKWSDADFFEGYSSTKMLKSSEVIGKSFAISSPRLVDNNTIASLTYYVRDHVYTRILMRKGFPLEVAAMIVLPLVLHRRHYTIPAQLDMALRSARKRKERQVVYDFIANKAFITIPLGHDEHHRCPKCYVLQTYAGGRRILHSPECDTSDYKFKEPLIPDIFDTLVKLGCKIDLSKAVEWPLHFNYNEQSMDRFWLKNRKYRLRSISDCFEWDVETAKAQAMRAYYLGDIKKFLEAWKSQKN